MLVLIMAVNKCDTLEDQTQGPLYLLDQLSIPEIVSLSGRKKMTLPRDKYTEIACSGNDDGKSTER